MDVNQTAISACIGSVYQAAYDEAAWPTAIEALRSLFQGSKACLVRVGPGRGPNDLIATNDDPAFQHRYISEFAHKPNIFESAVARAPIGFVYHDLKFIGSEALRGSRLWNDWMAPQDMFGGLTSKLLVSGESWWFFDVQRGRKQPQFEASDAELLERIGSHLRRAIQISCQGQMARVLFSSLSHLSFGILVVDSSRHILMTNDAAEEILAAPQGAIFRRAGVLSTSDPTTNAQLQRFICDACFRVNGSPGLGGDLVVSLKSEDDMSTKLAISIGSLALAQADTFPQGPCALVIIRPIKLGLSAGFVEEIRRLFGLTPKEASIAAALAAGEPLKTIAIDEGVKSSTARTHLLQIFRKTGTNQQSQLVALLKDVQPIVRRY